MSNPKGAIKKGNNWYTKTTGTLLTNTQGAGSNGAGKWFARDKKGNIWYYDPKTGKYTSKKYLENNKPNVNSWNRKAQEAYYAGQNTLRSNSNKADVTALSDLSNRFKIRAEAFNFARQHGASGFIWKGGSYNTRDASETSIEQWQTNMEKARKANGTPSGYTSGKSGIYNNGKYLVGDENGQYHQKRMSDQSQGVELSNANVNPGSRKRDVEYSSAYDPFMFGNFLGIFSPSNQIGAISRAYRGEGAGSSFIPKYVDNLVGLYDSKAPEQNLGLGSITSDLQEEAKDHPNITAGANFAFDMLFPGGGLKAATKTTILKNGIKTIGRKYKTLPSTIERVPLYQGELEINPFSRQIGTFTQNGKLAGSKMVTKKHRKMVDPGKQIPYAREVEVIEPAQYTYNPYLGFSSIVGSIGSNQETYFNY